MRNQKFFGFAFTSALIFALVWEKGVTGATGVTGLCLALAIYLGSNVADAWTTLKASKSRTLVRR